MRTLQQDGLYRKVAFYINRGRPLRGRPHRAALASPARLLVEAPHSRHSLAQDREKFGGQLGADSDDNEPVSPDGNRSLLTSDYRLSPYSFPRLHDDYEYVLHVLPLRMRTSLSHSKRALAASYTSAVVKVNAICSCPRARRCGPGWAGVLRIFSVSTALRDARRRGW